MDNHIFRSALNGFNRHDVMGYIEKTQKAASERAHALETQINELRGEVEQLRAALESCTGERDALHGQLSDLTNLHEQTETELKAAQEGNCVLQADVQAARAEQDALRVKLQGMEQEVAAAREEKERVAQLELEARKRADALIEETHAKSEEMMEQTKGQAQEILVDARAQADEMICAARDRAEEVRAAMEEQVRATGVEANELVASVETIAAHVASELRKMDVAVAQLPISFNHLKDGMKSVLEQAEDRSVAEN